MQPYREPLLQPVPGGGASAAAVVLRTQAALLAHAALPAAAAALASELAQALQCTRVAVGMFDGRTLDVVATSEGPSPDARLEAAAAIRAAMHEAVDQSATLNFPHAGTDFPPVLLAHGALAAAGSVVGVRGPGAAVCTVPVKGMSGVVGAITFERAGAFAAHEVALCEDAISFAGPVLELKRLAGLPWWRRIVLAAREWAAAHGSTAGFRLGAGVAVVGMVLAFFMPLAYSVSAPARLEGSVQRVMVAPADGFLRQANVRAGDAVRQGQVLAEMAIEDLLLERQRRASELAQHENAYRAAQARNDRTQMVISQSKAGEAQAMLSLADSQVARARIEAPFDGVVIKGDLTQTLGAPVQRGEVLLTIAPDDSFRLMVEVDESDIGAVQPGQQGRLALAALPEQSFAFTVKRIVPVAASANARNYFEVEATLADSAGSRLRPGLSGVARIDAGGRPLWWQLTHRVFNWLRLAVWSVGL